MQYKPLSKLYYVDKSDYKLEYEKRFYSENCVKIDFPIKGNQAFYILSPEIHKMTTSILRADKKIERLVDILPGVAVDQFTRRCLIDEIIVTNRIEGVHSTRREISYIINKLGDKAQQQGKRVRLLGLVNKYLMLLTNEEIPLRTCENIRSLYDELVLDEVIAEDADNAPDGKIFRKGSTSITTATDKEIHRGLYPEQQIIDAMNKALAFLWDENIDILHRICLFHYFFEYIHPFYDGNGRTGRFIVSYLLSKELEPRLAYRLSVTVQENITEYYKTFEVCNDPHNLGDLTPFLITMLGLIQKATEQLQEALEKRYSRLNRYYDLISKLPNNHNDRTKNAYYLLIQAGLFSEDGVDYDTITNFLKCSRSTAAKEINKIRESGLLIEKTVERKTYFEINIEKLDELDQQ